MTQFDIWFANLPAVAGSIQSGMRPVVIVSNNAANKFSPVITAVPLTSNLHKTVLPTHVLLREPGLKSPSLALCEQILSVDKSCLVKRIGSVESSFARLALRHALLVLLNLAA